MPEETTVNETNKRTRINISLTAKGLAQFDCTTEYDTPEKSVEEMGKAIDLIRNLIKEKGLKSVEDAA